jgi:hypothetical protein
MSPAPLRSPELVASLSEGATGLPAPLDGALSRHTAPFPDGPGERLVFLSNDLLPTC